uniref:Uncharacterized protein n=1 Tax=Theileria annulata TaxID=5874 RepID=A0A3B0N361_THEAN
MKILKFLALSLVVFGVRNGITQDLEEITEKSLRSLNKDLRPENRKLFLSFLGNIFKPIIRGIANVVSPPDPPPPPPPPQPQIIYQTVAPKPEPNKEVKKEESKNTEVKPEKDKKAEKDEHQDEEEDDGDEDEE